MEIASFMLKMEKSKLLGFGDMRLFSIASEEAQSKWFKLIYDGTAGSNFKP